MTFGEKLKNARLAIGLSQEQLSEKLCVSRQAITKWENNRGLPDILNLKALSELLNVSIDYLLDDEITFEQSVLKEKIEWEKYPSVKKFSIALKEDYVVKDFYPDADSITQLSWNTKYGTIGEHVLDFFAPGVMYTADHIKDSSIYYLVQRNGVSTIANVTDEYIISKRLPQYMVEKNIQIGDIIFSLTKHKVL